MAKIAIFIPEKRESEMTTNLSQTYGSRDPGWSKFMTAIFAQAVFDARGRNPIKALDAVLWLASPDAESFLEGVGFEADPLTLLTTGRLEEIGQVWAAL